MPSKQIFWAWGKIIIKCRGRSQFSHSPDLFNSSQSSFSQTDLQILTFTSLSLFNQSIYHHKDIHQHQGHSQSIRNRITLPQKTLLITSHQHQQRQKPPSQKVQSSGLDSNPKYPDQTGWKVSEISFPLHFLQKDFTMLFLLTLSRCGGKGLKRGQPARGKTALTIQSFPSHWSTALNQRHLSASRTNNPKPESSTARSKLGGKQRVISLINTLSLSKPRKFSNHGGRN